MYLPKLASIIPFLPFTPQQLLIPQPTQLTFTLKHSHATVLVDHAHNSSSPLTLFSSQSHPSTSSRINIRTVPTRVYRPRSQAAFQAARQRSFLYGQSERLPWDEDVVPGPDITDRETLLELAKMTNNAYTTPDQEGWYDLGGKWNKSDPVGWEPDADSFRGHIFVSDSTPPTVVLSIKGTSLYIPGQGGGGPTVAKDKLNDNLLFSCCCARVNWKWTTVCDCYAGGWQCDKGCLQESLKEESLFYPIGTNLYNNLTYLYPDANIWIIGHSLGGSLAGLLGLTFGAPVVGFQSVGERMASTRLHLPLPPSDAHITQVYHTADPIAMGTCNGMFSWCADYGYALESKCHLGRAIRYDTVSERGWGVSIRTHTITAVVERLLATPWNENDTVPDAAPEVDCVECYSWDYGDYKNKTLTII